MKISGAKIVVETLIEQGCDTIFGYPGGQVIDLFDELYSAESRIKHIIAAHEQGAAHAADGYARSTGKVGVVIATSGPGATNLVTGIATAYLDSVPMVAITGNVACSLIGRDSFQEVDIVGITMPITKHNFIVKDIKELADTLRTAFKIAKSGRQGPVLVDIPQDVQQALCEYESNAQPVIPYPLTFASEDKLQKAAALINSCEKPYIYFGGGVISGKASQQVTALAEKIDAPLGCSLMGLSAVSCDHPRFLGMQGMHGHFASTVAQNEADLVIALGVRFSNRAAGDDSRYPKHTSIIHIDIDGAELHKNVPADVAIKGDLHDSLERLIAMAEEKKHPQWWERIGQLRTEEKTHTAAALSAAKARRGGRKLSPYEIIDAISSRAGEDAVIVTDVGQHQMWTAQRYPLKKPRTFLSSGGLGTMGFGLGAAVGAACATGRRCILFTGDGSFGMDLCELATAVSQKLPITVVIMNNGVLGMVRQMQTLFYDKRYSNTTLDRSTDFAKLAEAFGAKGGHAASAEELEKLADEALSCNTPFVIDCEVDSDELVLPMLPNGGSIDDMITEIK
ncbi:MAG: biosynthetic-type acetolactate synthase large subunit [Ruminococcus sp.]|uniref:biosynthetic-type acetolactate synthase large subunit n=1 Tax=Ruminococcus sp. TaxID=41978 RepID=UPI0025FD8666|nr:biosynthetic-type acetolactate synthase large subunit [Ruminococcus sp.]MBR5681986.1 biosynthetic-type acetolactate synthase large subunit [Ruminococcus sp.]